MQKTRSWKEKNRRKKKLRPRCYRRLLNYVRNNNKQPLYMIAAQFRTVNGTKLSVRTIQRYVHCSSIHRYVAASKPHLTSKHINARLDWYTERYMWSMTEWNKAEFTGEAYFTMRPLRNYARVWRREGTRYETRNMVSTFKSGFVSLPVWGLFSSLGRSTLVRIKGH